jgi:hypothetical protein
MITSLRRELLQTLVQLGSFYPGMRFSQLLCFACSMAGKESPGFVGEVEDSVVLEAIRRHLPRRARQLDVMNSVELSTVPPLRGELTQVLDELGDQHPEWNLGRLVFNLAALVHANVYDIEDEQLLVAARSHSPGVHWFNWYADKLEHCSTIRERSCEQSYRCPCCRYRTLYERGGFEICPVCFWEDDGQDNEDADSVRGGPNGSLSLTQARENYARHGTCDPRFVENVRPPQPEEMSDER